MVSISPMRTGPLLDIYLKSGEVLVQCIIIIVRPGYSSLRAAIYLAVLYRCSLILSSLTLSGIGQS